MPPPPLKKTKTTSVSAADPVMGSIINIETDSDSGPRSESMHDSGEESDCSSSDSDSDDSDKTIVIQNAPLSPPPTVSKRKRGRKPKKVEEVDISGP